jgi:hypothetical protein
MLSFNPEFAALIDIKAVEIIKTIETVLIPYFTQHIYS